jgi:tRNA (guanine9-N1)-methyltransferase
MVGEPEKESKNAKRKAQRFQRLKEIRKAHRKAKKDLAKQKRKETNPDREPDSIHVSKKDAKNEAIERLKKVQSNPESHLKICIDLQYEELMNDKELTHLARQLSRVYGWNKKSIQPCHLSFCNLKPESKTYQICCSKNDGFANYIIEKSEKSVEEFDDNIPKSSIIYLSPDSDEILEELSTDTLYVIGGLVDESVQKHSTLSFAGSHQIKTAKLPIEKYCQRSTQGGSYKQILTINQVFEILLSKFNGLSWSECLVKSLPSRIGFTTPIKNSNQ